MLAPNIRVTWVVAELWINKALTLRLLWPEGRADWSNFLRSCFQFALVETPKEPLSFVYPNNTNAQRLQSLNNSGLWLTVLYFHGLHLLFLTCFKMGRKCDQCGYVARDNSGLKKHMNIVHEKRKDFKCELCGDKFGASSNLYRHTKHVHRCLL